MFVETKFSFEAAIDVVGLFTGLSVNCVLSVELNDSYKELCEEYDLEGVRRANIAVVISVVVKCRLL